MPASGFALQLAGVVNPRAAEPIPSLGLRALACHGAVLRRAFLVSLSPGLRERQFFHPASPVDRSGIDGIVRLQCDTSLRVNDVKPAPTINQRRPPWYQPRSIARSIAIRPKVYCAALAAAVVAFLLPREVSTNVRTALAGDVGAFVYLALALQLMVNYGGDTLKRRAARQDDSAIVILVLILIAIALGFSTIFGVLRDAKQATGGPRAGKSCSRPSPFCCPGW